MIWLLLYLAVGVVNVVVADLQGRLIITTQPGKRRAGKTRRDWPTGLVEVVFYVLCWPVQLAFWMYVRITGFVESRWPS